MIIFAVESQKLRVLQIRNALRVPAGLISISSVRIQRIQDFPVQHILRRGKRAFHLIIYHAVIRQLILWIFQLIAPALLAENFLFFINIRKKHRIHINMDQIHEIGVVTARHRIHRLIRIGHSI